MALPWERHAWLRRSSLGALLGIRGGTLITASPALGTSGSVCNVELYQSLSLKAFQEPVQ
jgi:hypothetical protein